MMLTFVMAHTNNDRVGSRILLGEIRIPGLIRSEQDAATDTAFAGCGGAGSRLDSRLDVTDQPDWKSACQSLDFDPADVASGPGAAERGTRSSESITVGDSISLRYRGWRYTWKVERVEGAEPALKELEARKLNTDSRTND